MITERRGHDEGVTFINQKHCIGTEGKSEINITTSIHFFKSLLQNRLRVLNKYKNHIAC